MATLLENGLHEDALHYLEFVALEPTSGGKPILWFGDPLVSVAEIPKPRWPCWLPANLRQDFNFWYGVAAESSVRHDSS
jgi:hypothetical protein